MGTTTKLRVLLLQLPVPNNPATNVPLALGYLKAYAQAQGLLEQVEIEILTRSVADHAGDALLVDEVVTRKPDVLGASLYTWNSERTLDVLGRARERLPKVVTFVGGPEVQRDNAWVVEHPAVDLAVVGEGEQTFAELLRLLLRSKRIREDTRRNARVKELLNFRIPSRVFADRLFLAELRLVDGIAYKHDGELVWTAERTALSDLSVVPSPYLLGYLECPADSMLMVEVSRWCPYACSFCLYGRNMGARLGDRYFGLQRVLDEIRWGREQGATRVHFVEANLNLVPIFRQLMDALPKLNADRRMAFYAELRGEHLSDAVVDALDRANVRFVEVGLQTSNPVALRASHRRTDLAKWAAGTRRLYGRDIEVYLDVILGLPEDDEAGVLETLDFIGRENLGSYDIFMLQALPGTAVRREAATFAIVHQQRPPYYVLETDSFDRQLLRRLRRELRTGAGLDPDAVEGVPSPRRDALLRRDESRIVTQLRFVSGEQRPGAEVVGRLANQVDVVVEYGLLAEATAFLAPCIEANPSTLFDVYVLCDAPPDPAGLRVRREQLPWRPGYLDRVAEITVAQAEQIRVSPRCFVVLPWSAVAEPGAYNGVAGLIWEFEATQPDPLPLGAWRAAGGSGIVLRFAPDASHEYRAAALAEAAEWENQTGRVVWSAESVSQPAVSVYSGRI